MFGPAPDADGDWLPALSADELTDGGHDNLTALGIERIDVVNLRIPDAGTSARGAGEGDHHPEPGRAAAADAGHRDLRDPRRRQPRRDRTSIEKMVAEVAGYVPGYRLRVPPQFADDRVSIFLRWRAAAISYHRLPATSTS